MTAHVQRSSAYNQGNRFGTPASAALQTGLEAAHQRVELCIRDLETLTEQANLDGVLISSARMRIGQANFARRRLVSDACAHLALFLSPAETHSLRQLQTDDLETFRLTSRHIHDWTAQAIKVDWHGYCQAFRTLRTRVRAAIGAEKRMLYPLLRRQMDR